MHADPLPSLGALVYGRRGVDWPPGRRRAVPGLCQVGTVPGRYRACTGPVPLCKACVRPVPGLCRACLCVVLSLRPRCGAAGAAPRVSRRDRSRSAARMGPRTLKFSITKAPVSDSGLLGVMTDASRSAGTTSRRPGNISYFDPLGCSLAEICCRRHGGGVRYGMGYGREGLWSGVPLRDPPRPPTLTRALGPPDGCAAAGQSLCLAQTSLKGHHGPPPASASRASGRSGDRVVYVGTMTMVRPLPSVVVGTANRLFVVKPLAACVAALIEP